MNLRFVALTALRELRAGRKRIVFYLVSMALGVGALVAINAFRSDIAAAVRAESRALLGADLELSSRDPFPDPVSALLDSVARAGVPVSFVTSFSSMALVERSGRTRLVEVQALSGAYPYYGRLGTDPPGGRRALDTGRVALVDPAVLVQLDAELGDTVRIGEAAFTIVAAVTSVPGDIGLRSIVGPRVYIPGAYVAETGLLRFGSRVRYAAYLKLDEPDGVEQWLNTNQPTLDDADVRAETVADREEQWAEALDIMARFLGLVGLAALLLGGIGVASAVHVFVKRKLDTVAVLRCLGASQGSVFAIYLVQAAIMGIAGALLGVGLGLAVQRALPGLLADFLPITITPVTRGSWIVAGLGIGVGGALLFALLPLLTIREVTPLRALRREYEGPTPRRDAVRLLCYAALGISILALGLWQAPFLWAGLAFAGGAAGGTLFLWAVAWGLTKATRRFFPARAPYVVRQGVANLFRPHNQTVAVTLAVGSGIFLLGTLHVVQRNLLTQLAFETAPDRPNVVVFDIQPDQRDGVAAIVTSRGESIRDLTPIVPGRIAKINDRTVADLLEDTTGSAPSRWAVRREYRNTYRDTMTSSEGLVRGAWFDDQARRHTDSAGRRVPLVSVEIDLARELGVEVGDRITWDVQGVFVESEVASLRRVQWARFEPNFFVVFEPGVLEDAPRTYVALLSVEGAIPRAELQRDLVRRYSNLSALDVTLLLETLDRIVGSVAAAIRFMAVFTLASGLIVLLGAIATSRFQRLRESVLLKTLGAAAPQIRAILVAEYGTLGGLAGLTGTLLAGAAGWALVTFLFELSFRLPVLSLAGFTLASIVVTTLIGLLSSGDAVRRPPLAVLREMAE